MQYKTIVFFRDLQDGNRPYSPGDIFPREGLTVTAARLAELSGSDNLRGKPLIREIKAEPVAAAAPAAPVEAAPVEAAPAPVKKTRKKGAKKTDE